MIEKVKSAASLSSKSEVSVTSKNQKQNNFLNFIFLDIREEKTETEASKALENSEELKTEEKNKILKVLSRWGGGPTKKSATIVIPSANIAESKPIEKNEEENYIKSLEEQIENFEKYFAVISEVVDELIQSSPNNIPSPPIQSPNQKITNFSLLRKRSMSIKLVSNKSPLNPSQPEVGDQFFSERRKIKPHKSIGSLRNK